MAGRMIEKDYTPRGIPAPCGCEYEAGAWTVCEKHRRDPEGAPFTDDDSIRRAAVLTRGAFDKSESELAEGVTDESVVEGT